MEVTVTITLIKCINDNIDRISNSSNQNTKICLVNKYIMHHYILLAI